MAATANSTSTNRDARGFRGWFSRFREVASRVGRFFGPAQPPSQSWLYVCELGRLVPGESLNYLTPTGATVTVARRDAAETTESFLAMSSTCPHVGCQVHWETANCRFSCPCYGGAAVPEGQVAPGLPTQPRRPLLRYPLKIEDGLLFLAVPVESAASD